MPTPPILPLGPQRSQSSPVQPAVRGALSPGASSNDAPEKICKIATDFEALLIAQMLKSARESGGGLGSEGMTGDDEQDETNSTVVELGEQQMAQALAASGGLGIAKMVIAGLTNHANR